MELFKDICCSDCGKKAGLLTRTKLADGKYLCYDCTVGIPSYIMDDLSRCYKFWNYKALKNYMQYSNKTLKSKFRETTSYGDFHIDEDNKLFYIGSSFLDEPLYFEFKNISSFNMDYKAETFKEGILEDKVLGRVVVDLVMMVPNLTYNKILAKDVKAKADTNFLGTKVTYEYPREMEEFLARFITAWNEASDKAQQEHTQETVKMNELEKAKVLFMLDDVDNITIEDLKQQRNRLIKIFHSGTGNTANTKYVEKINNAYEIIKTSFKR